MKPYTKGQADASRGRYMQSYNLNYERGFKDVIRFKLEQWRKHDRQRA